MSKTSARQITDAFGRPFLNFRISVTQRCNLNCPYCHGEGQQESDMELTPREVARIAKAAVALGATKIKITGGEPLLRKNLPAIVKKISAIRKIEDISMVTNASLLTADVAAELKNNDLQRININIPSIDADTYARLTGGDLSNALAGVEAAKGVGFYPIKINMLVLAGENDDQVDSMIDFAKTIGAILQIIELEPLQISSEYYARHHADLQLIEGRIAKRARSVRVRESMQGRRVYSLDGVEIEIVRPVENTEFCLHCTRMRLTSDGKVKPCLMRDNQLVNLLTPLRSGATDKELEELLATAVRQRRPFYAGCSGPR